eukprot:SAG25_NODE_455_length_7865_cov_2.578032_5_plen_146_part_00
MMHTIDVFSHGVIILWAADHGDGQSDHFHWRKGFPYEFASHVPWMLRWPKNDPRAAAWERGRTITDVVELRDVFPTMLDAAGVLRGPKSVVPPGYKMDGDSLLCLLGAPKSSGEEGEKGATAAAKYSTCRGGAWRPHLDLEHFRV